MRQPDKILVTSYPLFRCIFDGSKKWTNESNLQLPSTECLAVHIAVSSSCAQTINQQIVLIDLILELRQLINIPFAAQVSALLPLSMSVANTNCEPGSRI